MSATTPTRTIGWTVLSCTAIGVLAACGPATKTAAPTPPPATTAVGTLDSAPPSTPTSTPANSGGGGNGGNTGGGGNLAPAWPWPEDCISYNPNSVSVAYDAGVYQVTAGSIVVLQAAGQPGDDTGTKALALAQHYRRHCFLGRTNSREDQGMYVFDYWRDPTGVNTPIPGGDDDCSSYNKNNLTVEDMGDGNGWRVKDHDHVLQLFDNGTDARNGKLVLAKYSTICFIGDGDDSSPSQISYLL